MRIKKRFVIPVLVCILCMVGTWYLEKFTYNKRLFNDLAAYDYLSNYHCWYGVFGTTLYTLRESECGKAKGHHEFGVTYSGTYAVPMRTIAVDPQIVPLGSILVDTSSGRVYIAEDTGSAIKGYRVDVFIGQGTKGNVESAGKFGSQRRLYMVIENMVKRTRGIKENRK